MKVALFVTCLVEAFAPEVASAAARLVARSGANLEVVTVGMGCCGQPAWNAGYAAQARALARQLIPRLAGFDLVVVPSGSCAAMLVRYYPHLFAEGDPLAAQAGELAARCRELSAHLAERGLAAAGATDPAEGRVAFHPSCHSLRGVGVGDAGERCLAAAGCTLAHPADREECCGFGGIFAVKEEALSTAMADRKLDSLLGAGASTVVAGELGCLLHLEGRARRRGMRLSFKHLAEALVERDGHD